MKKHKERHRRRQLRQDQNKRRKAAAEHRDRSPAQVDESWLDEDLGWALTGQPRSADAARSAVEDLAQSRKIFPSIDDLWPVAQDHRAEMTLAAAVRMQLENGLTPAQVRKDVEFEIEEFAAGGPGMMTYLHRSAAEVSADRVRELFRGVAEDFLEQFLIWSPDHPHAATVRDIYVERGLVAPVQVPRYQDPDKEPSEDQVRADAVSASDDMLHHYCDHAFTQGWSSERVVDILHDVLCERGNVRALAERDELRREFEEEQGKRPPPTPA